MARNKKHKNDKFYTKNHVALKLIEFGVNNKLHITSANMISKNFS